MTEYIDKIKLNKSELKRAIILLKNFIKDEDKFNSFIEEFLKGDEMKDLLISSENKVIYEFIKTKIIENRK